MYGKLMKALPKENQNLKCGMKDKSCSSPEGL